MTSKNSGSFLFDWDAIHAYFSVLVYTKIPSQDVNLREDLMRLIDDAANSLADETPTKDSTDAINSESSGSPDNHSDDQGVLDRIDRPKRELEEMAERVDVQPTWVWKVLGFIQSGRAAGQERILPPGSILHSSVVSKLKNDGEYRGIRNGKLIEMSAAANEAVGDDFDRVSASVPR
jgi:hypothetical protein